jgi:hypothetical protein
LFFFLLLFHSVKWSKSWKVPTIARKWVC